LLSGWSQGTDYSRIYPELSNSKLVRTYFWPDEPEKAYLVLSITFILIGFSLISNFFYGNKSYAWLLIALVTFIFLSSFPNWWFGSKPGDMARHNLESAIMWRVAGLLAGVRTKSGLRERQFGVADRLTVWVMPDREKKLC
jgi:hypothetical protein